MLYTRKGDKGDTYFFGSKDRFSKSGERAEALGALDELNSLVGLCRAKSRGVDIKIGGQALSEILEEVQQNLFIVQAVLAGADKTITQEKVDAVEKIIDSIEEELPEIKTFFLAGGTELSGLLDYARAVSRKAERRAVKYLEMREIEVGDETRSYLNRLSSLLYALVRIVNLKSGVLEIPPTY